MFVKNNKRSNISQLLFFIKKQKLKYKKIKPKENYNIQTNQHLIPIENNKENKNPIPAYAVKSDNGKKSPNKNQFLAYAVKSDDGTKNQTKTNS